MTLSTYRFALQNLGATAARTETASAYEAVRHRHVGRPYHSWRHVEHKSDWTERIADKAVPSLSLHDRAVLSLADVYHDAVYDPRSVTPRNEQASAELAVREIGRLGVEPGRLAEIVRLILLTASHDVSPDDRLGQVMIDSDLAIFGESDEVYDRYAAAIRQEYGWVDQASYREGRGKVLNAFLSRERIYWSPLLNETRARENLARELRSLRAA